MKKEKVTKEITLTGNTSILFGDPNNTNGDMLIIGNFKDICGHAEWYGKHSGENYWSVDMTKFNETIMTNVGMIVNTIRNGHKIFFIGSSDSIDYWTKLVCNFASPSYAFFTDGEEPSDATVKKILKNQFIKVVDDAVYEDSARKYGDVRTTLSESKINERILNNINILFNNIKKTKMKFSNIVLNPPYNGSLHLEILKKSLDLLTGDGHLVVVEPATWLINVRRNGKAKLYDEIKNRINGHVRSVVIENLNKDFGISQQVPFSITDIDMTYNGSIEFSCCGETKNIKSLYDCNLIGDYKTIRSILEKVQTYGDMMVNHLFNENKEYAENSNYIGISEIYPSPISARSRGGDTVNGDDWYENHASGSYYKGYFYSCFHTGYEISPNKCFAFGQGHGAVKAKRFSNKLASQLVGSYDELNNWKHFIFNNKLPLFLNIVLTIDQHNVSHQFIPWLVDKQYTDDEINTLFGFTDEEIKLMDDTLKKFERNSPWFKRYMCGKESQDETTVPEPIVFEVSDFDNTLEDIMSMDEDTLVHEYPAWYSAWEVETNSGETDYSFRFWLKEQFEYQKRLAEMMEDDD